MRDLIREVPVARLFTAIFGALLLVFLTLPVACEVATQSGDSDPGEPSPEPTVSSTVAGASETSATEAEQSTTESDNAAQSALAEKATESPSVRSAPQTRLADSTPAPTPTPTAISGPTAIPPEQTTVETDRDALIATRWSRSTRRPAEMDGNATRIG